MSTAVVSRLRGGAGLVGRFVTLATTHVRRSLAVIVGVQLLLAGSLFASVAHNGWLTYQGGDQMWLVTSGWLMAHGTLATPVVSHGWPVIVAPISWLTGSTTTGMLPYTTILQVAILGPLGTLAVYDIAARIAGRAAGLWCALVLVLAPYLATPLFVERYQERWTDQILVQATGFTQLADYPSTIVVLVCTALVLMIGLHTLIEHTRLGRNIRAVSESRDYAALAGIDVKSLKFTEPVQTANGTAYTASVRLKTAAIGPIVVKDVEALVAEPGNLKESLLGMSFLRRLRSYEFSGDFLTIRD